MTEKTKGGQTNSGSAADTASVQDGQTLVSSVPEGRIPLIPGTYRVAAAQTGMIPAEVAAGFIVSRIRNDKEAMQRATAKGQVVVYKGDRNPDKPEELLIRNEEVFDTTPEGQLCYAGDLLVVWREEVAAAKLAAGQARARTACKDGVKTKQVEVNADGKSLLDREKALIFGT